MFLPFQYKLRRMIDDSNFVIRWEIINATAKYSVDKVESDEFNGGGFKWTVAVEKRIQFMDFALQCAVDHNGPWKCEMENDMYILVKDGSMKHLFKNRFSFDNNTDRRLQTSNYWWCTFTDSDYSIDDKVTFEYRITIISSEGATATPIIFSAPNKMSNVILNIGDERLHVSKEYLAVHSPVFEAMFFGEFAEKGKDEVEIKDVVYKEFIDLLQLIYVRKMEITDRTVSHILKLADQFQIEHIIEFSVKHLMQSKGIDVVKKLLLADKYNLTSITSHCLQSFTNIADLTEQITSSPEYSNFSVDMKATICDRIAKLPLQKA